METLTLNSKIDFNCKIKDIVYFESVGNLFKIHTINGKKYLFDCGFECIEESLPFNKFFRIHDLFIINVDYLKKIKVATSRNAQLNSNLELAISSKRYLDLIYFLKSIYDVW